MHGSKFRYFFIYGGDFSNIVGVCFYKGDETYIDTHTTIRFGFNRDWYVRNVRPFDKFEYELKNIAPKVIKEKDIIKRLKKAKPDLLIGHAQDYYWYYHTNIQVAFSNVLRSNGLTEFNRIVKGI